MRLQLFHHQDRLIRQALKITGSKSETNRLLLLKALFPNLKIENLSNSDDGLVMQLGLRKTQGTVNIHHAGTAMRFLTAYFASQEGKNVVVTGSPRMKERPIKVLVDALRELGADIAYENAQGFPPLKISGRRLMGKKVTLPANISSQYISALMLIAPGLENGLEIDLIGKITSIPYIKMTMSLLQQIGIDAIFGDSSIRIAPKSAINDTTLLVESDWSSASYLYSISALGDLGSTIKLSSYKENSLQGDSVLMELYKDFGVRTTFSKNQMVLTKTGRGTGRYVEYDLSNAPDIAQTIAVTCFGLGAGCHLTGLHTLPIKETDRLLALKTELAKLGAAVRINAQSLKLDPSDNIMEGISVNTYNDHRMAMAFAPLALRTTLFINDAEVVSKSYPNFWNDLKTLGMEIQEV